VSGVALLVIAKEPVPGRVKTRLCPPCTPEQAAGLARAALADTLHCIAAVSAPRRVLVLDGAPGPWLPEGFDVVPQCAGGLAERLGGAFAAVRWPAFLVGMDTPQLCPPDVAAAVRSLETPGVDAVLAPAVDGGWWGIGLRRPDPAAFHGVPMSTPHTGARQLERLSALGLRTRLLPPLLDIDTFADAVAVAAIAPASRFAAALAALAPAAGRRAA
jgi:uncharacterized protein